MLPPDKKDLHYDRPFYEQLVQPKGYLTLDMRCHACFHYTMLAGKARVAAGTGPESQIIQYRVGDTPPEWMESRDWEIAKSVAIIYGLESPDEFLKFKKEAWTQAVQLGADPEICTTVLGVTASGDLNKIQ